MLEIERIWLTDNAVHIRSVDGREASEAFADYPRLAYATKKQLENYEADRFGIHWPDLDEDLAFEYFFNHKPRTPLFSIFLAHHELNASAVARRLGISQSLFAQYISGTKKPSQQRMQEIINCLHQIGQELLEI